ncbi:transketolase [Geosporobacter subterraneus DSM 17957]|uniref:Transketolase n=1 Tax=Geosporobacter subterraneus DSM 17957 TaxID=1121919 RepID=A0A1M6EFF5_9FIRM|nr:transketolase C-terminal domain-containing protein [Geosporobacter subterraneus]SHI84195.1 transketolase [Geosporobacter subterraneus DSM 17957]
MFQLAEKQQPKELRAVYQETLMELMEENENIIVCDADLVNASGTGKLFRKYPKRCINMGISEANMIGASCGMSLTGKIPFVHTFAPFATRRVFDQLYLSGCYQQANIRIYGSDPGFWALHNGGTHTSVEDLALTRAVPQLTVIAPADAAQFKWVIKNTIDRYGMYYFRCARKAVPDIYSEGSQFEIGKGNIICEGTDIAIFAIGEMIAEAIKARKILEEYGISSTIVDMFTVKPLDEELVREVSRGKRVIVAAENHSKIGGLGSAIAEVLAESPIEAPFISIAIQDHFGEVGTQDYLQRKFGLNADAIVSKVLEKLNI